MPRISGIKIKEADLEVSQGHPVEVMTTEAAK